MPEPNDWTQEELSDYVAKLTPVTIPVNITIHGQQTILDLTSIENILRNAEIITIEDCGCRAKWHKCDAPMDVCLSLNDQAQEAMKNGVLDEFL